jgi:DNA polymerase-3 subunit alpha
LCCEGEKQTTPGRGRGYRYGCLIRNTISRRGGDEKKLFTDLPEAISNLAECGWK